MRTSTWLLVAAAVLALLVFVVRPAVEGAKAKKDNGAKKKDPKQKKGKKTKTGLANYDDCASRGKFYDPGRGKCMTRKNCKGSVKRGSCMPTKGGQRIWPSIEGLKKEVEQARKCTQDEMWSRSKKTCVSRVEDGKPKCTGYIDKNNMCVSKRLADLLNQAKQNAPGNGREPGNDANDKPARTTCKDGQAWSAVDNKCIGMWSSHMAA